MTSLVSCTRVEIVRHVRPQMGYILQYLLSLLGFASSNCHLLEAGRKGAGEVFMEEGLCSCCTRNPNSGIFAVIRVPNTYGFVCRYRRFSPEVQPTRKVVKYFKRFVKCGTLKFRFLPLTVVNCSFAGHSTETAGGRPTYRYIWRSAIETKFSLRNITRYFIQEHQRTPRDRMGATRWALP